MASDKKEMQSRAGEPVPIQRDPTAATIRDDARHSPLPWHQVVNDGRPQTAIACRLGLRVALIEWHGSDVTMANTEFIVRAVNSHAALVDALRELSQACSSDDTPVSFPMLIKAGKALLLAESK